MSYKESYDLAHNPLMLERLMVATANVCKDVYIEPIATANHATRLLLVAHAGPEASRLRAFVKELALVAFALNPTLDRDATDQDLYDAVWGIWTAYALLLQANGVIGA